MLSTTHLTNVLVRSLDELRLCVFCLAALGLLACCNQASAQLYSYESPGVSIAQPIGHGAISQSNYYAPAVSHWKRGYQSRSGIPNFTHQDTPRGIHRRIPGQTFPAQTVVVNFTPPGSYSSPRQTSFRKNAFGRSVISRW